MTQEETVKHNQLIAEFMQIQVTEFRWREWTTLIIGDEDDAMDSGNLTYYNPNNDWNQLMQVIDSIKCVECEEYTLLDNIDYALTTIDIEATWLSAIEFLKWYNEQK